MGIFKNMGGNITGGNFLGGNYPGGNFPGGSLMGGNFPGESFPDTHNIISGSELKCASEHLKRNKQKMSAGKKTLEEKQTILLESVKCLR